MHHAWLLTGTEGLVIFKDDGDLTKFACVYGPGRLFKTADDAIRLSPRIFNRTAIAYCTFE